MWSDDLRINPPDDSAQNRPALAGAEGGATWIGWLSAVHSGIALQKLDAAGNLLFATPKRVSSYGYPMDSEIPPTLARSETDLVVAWSVASKPMIVAQRLDAEGRPQWIVPMPINRSSNPFPDARPPSLAAISAGGLMSALPVERADGQRGIYGQRLDHNGSMRWPHDRRFSEATGSVDQTIPAVAVNSAGESVVAWQDRRSDQAAIYLQRFDTTGQRLWSDNIRLSRHAFTETSQLAPDIAISGEDALVAWSDARSGQARIYLQRVAPSGQPVWDVDARISREQNGAFDQFSPALAVGAGSALLAWEEVRGQERRVLAQLLDAYGLPQWASDVVVSEPTTTARFPALALDAAGNALIVWIAQRDDQTDLFGQRLDRSGNKLWPQPLRLDQAAGLVNGLSMPAVALDATGTATVLWVDKRQSGIYLQRFDAEGKPLWADDLLLGATPGAALPDPDVALWPDGSALVVWQGMDASGRGAIFAQRFTPDGVPQWQKDGAPLRAISSAIRNGRRARVALDSAGRSTVVWQDERAMTADVFAQRLDAAGNRLWLEDQPVISADRFFVKQGVARSTVVDTTDANIQRATLTAQVDDPRWRDRVFLEQRRWRALGDCAARHRASLHHRRFGAALAGESHRRPEHAEHVAGD